MQLTTSEICEVDKLTVDVVGCSEIQKRAAGCNLD
jgi:hypothetical protein